MLSIVLALGAFLGIVLMGAGILTGMSPRRQVRKYKALDAPAEAWALDGGPAFQPLEMAQFTLDWPSRSTRESTGLPQPPWPSETWDDAYFGQHARADLQRMQETARLLDAKRERAYREEADKAAEVERGEAGVEQRRRAERKARQQQEQAKSSKKSKKKAEQAQRSQVEQVRTVVEEVITAGGGDVDAIPDAQEIAALVQKHGLSGAVEQLRARTGWDFKTAAKHLANVLRNS